MERYDSSALIRGMAHVGYTAEDRDQAMDILTNAFGIKHTRRQFSDQPYLSEVTGFPGCAINIGFAQIEGDRVPLEVLGFVNPRGAHMNTALGAPGASHVCFETDDLALFAQRLAAHGLGFLAAPQELSFGPWKGWKGAFLTMPDGFVMEFLQKPGAKQGEGVLTRLHHVGYSVADIGKIGDAFRTILDSSLTRHSGVQGYFDPGCDTGGEIETAGYLTMPGTDFLVELLQCSTDVVQPVATNMAGNMHLCFLVEDIMAAYEGLLQEGIRFVGPPGKITAGVNTGAIAGYLKDPYEIRCEFFQGNKTKVD